MAPDYGYDEDDNESEFGFEPTAAADVNHADNDYYSYGFTPVVRAPSPPFGRGSGAAFPPPRNRGRGGLRPPPAMAFTADEEVEYGYGYGFDAGRRSRELLSPVPSRAAAARFNFDKSYSDLSRLLM